MNLTRIWAIATVLLVIIIAAGGWFLGVSPQLERAATANEQRQQVETTNQLQEVTLSALRAQAEELPALQEQLDEARLAIPGEAAFPPFLQSLSDIADSSGVIVTSFASQPALPFVPAAEYAEALPAGLPAEQFVVIPVRVVVTGEQEQVLDFVETVQGSERYMLINDLRTTRDELEEGSTTVTGEFGGFVFVFLDEAPAPEETLEDVVDQGEIDAGEGDG